MKQRRSFFLGLVITFLLFSAFAVQEGWVVPEKYKTMKNPQLGVEDDDEIGADLWSEHCESCHGRSGLGDGKKADELDAELQDFTEDEFQDQSDGTLYYKSFFGKDEMPSFKKKITDEEERWLLINYLRTLAE